MITEGEKRSGPDVNIFDVIPLIDRFGEMDLVTDEVPKLRKLTGLEKLLKFIFPRSKFNQQFTASSGQGVDSFYDGGIVQAFRRGGDVYAEKEKYRDKSFSSNISGNVGGRDDRDQFEEARNLVQAAERIQAPDDLRIGEDVNVFTPVGGGFSDFAQSEAPISGIGMEQALANQAMPSEIKTPIEKLYRPADAPAPRSQAFIDSYNHPLAKFVTPLTDAFGKASGYNMDTEQGRYDFYNRTQETIARNKELQDQRQLDRERAERKLAEEQRLRDMIAGMMPKTAATPAPPMVTAPDAPTATPATPDYSSVVVQSDRVPGFDVGKISPYPQFRMPTEFTPVFPESLSANYFRDLFKNIGVNKMQEGGAVNQLDSAIDNFINAYR